MAKVLVVDDDEKLSDTIQEVLTRGGLIVDQALCAEDAEPMLAGFTYDLLILDWMMPGMHGIDFLAKIRAKGLKTPVLMLTGMDTVDNKIAGLDNGADDYLTKPFDRKELLARVRAMLRRPQLVESTVLNLAGVTLDTKTLKVTWQGSEIKLTKQEYQLLELLMRHKNEVFSHDALVERAWSSMSESSADTVRVHMSRLRKKFEGGVADCPLQTVHGKGYVFVAD
ncbi:MAG: response regulator transcription factor [Candidatus Obscuribacterales bacterium]|nr:response regulator transcription factor [Candidatus Obscuribacterales bacterium]